LIPFSLFQVILVQANDALPNPSLYFFSFSEEPVQQVEREYQKEELF
jgi:hypothetical protein